MLSVEGMERRCQNEEEPEEVENRIWGMVDWGSVEGKMVGILEGHIFFWNSQRELNSLNSRRAHDNNFWLVDEGENEGDFEMLGQEACAQRGNRYEQAGASGQHETSSSFASVTNRRPILGMLPGVSVSQATPA